ncbi:hypothetical protein QN374_17340, partial [Herbaspirillum sp. RTI4]|uniref:hypothetical protein n=1 Tax=Herbaspirillum sp. RTI4 TaxID=3048640 RepID=UPI002B23CC65
EDAFVLAVVDPAFEVFDGGQHAVDSYVIGILSSVGIFGEALSKEEATSPTNSVYIFVFGESGSENGSRFLCSRICR